MSRDDGFEQVAQSAVVTRGDGQVVAPRRTMTRATFERESRPLIQRIFQPQPVPVVSRPDPSAFTASGMHGVFR